VRFTDLIGSWHHLTFPIGQLTEDSFEDGFGFDASSLRGWAAINESDMLLIPDPARCWVDPFTEDTTICLIANVVDPITKEGYGLDPRSVAIPRRKLSEIYRTRRHGLCRPRSRILRL